MQGNLSAYENIAGKHRRGIGKTNRANSGRITASERLIGQILILAPHSAVVPMSLVQRDSVQRESLKQISMRLRCHAETNSGAPAPGFAEPRIEPDAWQFAGQIGREIARHNTPAHNSQAISQAGGISRAFIHAFDRPVRYG